MYCHISLDHNRCSYPLLYHITIDRAFHDWWYKFHILSGLPCVLYGNNSESGFPLDFCQWVPQGCFKTSRDPRYSFRVSRLALENCKVYHKRGKCSFLWSCDPLDFSEQLCDRMDVSDLRIAFFRFNPTDCPCRCPSLLDNFLETIDTENRSRIISSKWRTNDCTHCPLCLIHSSEYPRLHSLVYGTQILRFWRLASLLPV